MSFDFALLTKILISVMTPYYYLKQDEAAFPKVNFNQLTEDTFVNGTQLNFHVNVQKDHYRLIREIGAASTILLKNPNGTLPFNAANVQRWGIFGSESVHFSSLSPSNADSTSL